MEQGSQNTNSFHLAGVIPVAGQPLDFNLPWHDCMQPIAPNYLAIHHSIMECAWAGCETIWVVCHRDMQPLIRHEVGEYVQDPIWFNRSYERHPSEARKLIPIYYVPIHPKDRDRRDCLGWSVLYGANVAYWTSRKMSKWVIPDRYYASFPYGIYDNKILRNYRKEISSAKPFALSHNDATVEEGLYLGFTFDGEDFKRYRNGLREKATGLRPPGTGKTNEKLPIEERWSARHFSLDNIFESVIIEETNKVDLPFYYSIDSWEGYCEFISSAERPALQRPYEKILKYNEFNPIGEDFEKE